ncbi:MAG: DUF4157 domain-containing protein [Thermoanaerobaculia bacterium]
MRGGQPLPAPLRRQMEAVFGTDFSAVRVHVSGEAQALGALALTHGSHIHFAPGRYQPDTVQGRRLLGYELAHVVQQRAGRVRGPGGAGLVVVRDPRLEAEAERMAHRAAQPPPAPRATSPRPAAGGNRGAQSKVSQPAGWRRGSVVQRAAVEENKSTESSQSTYLTATLFNSLHEGKQLCENLASSAAGHSEDRFIDQTLPASVAYLDSKGNNTILIGINRSPCTSTDRAGDGTTTCNKAGAASGCAERLISLVNNDFVHMGTHYPIRLVIAIRNVYDMSVNSVLANEAMVATGRIAIEFQKIGGSSTKFMGTGVAKEMA